MQPIVEDLPDSEKPIQSAQAAARSNPISHLAIADRFDITMPNKQEENQLSEIWAYAQGLAKSESIPDIVWEVINLENRLGSPRLGESRLDRLYRYCKLRKSEEQIQNEIKSLYHLR